MENVSVLFLRHVGRYPLNTMNVVKGEASSLSFLVSLSQGSRWADSKRETVDNMTLVRVSF